MVPSDRTRRRPATKMSNGFERRRQFISVSFLILVAIPLMKPVLGFVAFSSPSNRIRQQQLQDSTTKAGTIRLSSSVLNQDMDATATTTQVATMSSAVQNKKKKKQLMGDWEELHGNYVLRPPAGGEAPRALLHFLGGALVGATPHVMYRYMLERLAREGYLIVATPYNLSFDHLGTCDAIIARFERIAPMLARQYGAIPVVGVGHSCGALLHLLITSLFPDTPRAANALLSFNNKPVKEAVPFFEEVFAPLFTTLSQKGNGKASLFPPPFSATEALEMGLQLARVASEGELPSNKLLTDIARLMLIPIPGGGGTVEVPSQLRDTIQKTLVDPSAQALSGAGVTPLLNDLVDIMDQIPLLIEEVADGARDFIPPPASVRAAARRAYRARRTLILGYAQDPLDESNEVEELLREAQSVTRMIRPMVDIALKRQSLEGGHAAPLLAPPSLDIATRAEDLLGVDVAKDSLQYNQADTTVEELIQWLEEGSL